MSRKEILKDLLKQLEANESRIAQLKPSLLSVESRVNSSRFESEETLRQDSQGVVRANVTLDISDEDSENVAPQRRLLVAKNDKPRRRSKSVGRTGNSRNNAKAAGDKPWAQTLRQKKKQPLQESVDTRSRVVEDGSVCQQSSLGTSSRTSTDSCDGCRAMQSKLKELNGVLAERDEQLLALAAELTDLNDRCNSQNSEIQQLRGQKKQAEEDAAVASDVLQQMVAELESVKKALKQKSYELQYAEEETKVWKQRALRWQGEPSYESKDAQSFGYAYQDDEGVSLEDLVSKEFSDFARVQDQSSDKTGPSHSSARAHSPSSSEPAATAGEDAGTASAPQNGAVLTRAGDETNTSNDSKKKPNLTAGRMVNVLIKDMISGWLPGEDDEVYY